MPKVTGGDAPKKVVMVGVKVDDPTRETLGEVCRREDRPLGYVARELMLRGLAAYGRDGLLKEPAGNAPAAKKPATIRVPRIIIGKEDAAEKKKRSRG